MTNRAAVDGIVRINVGNRPLYKPDIPFFLTICLITFTIGSFELSICILDLQTSKGNIAVHKQMPPTAPAIILTLRSKK